MSLFLRMIGPAPAASTLSLTDPTGWIGASNSAAGEVVSPETALKLSTVWACVTLLADVAAMLPLIMYENLDMDRGKRRAPGHPLYNILHDEPNERQTAFEFWSMNLAHLLLRGNSYSRIQPGARGFVDQLIPHHPDLVEVDELQNGRLRYQITSSTDGRKPYNQEDIFHIRGLSLDGIKGLSVISYAKETLGTGLAAVKYGGRFFRNDSRPGGALETDRTITQPAADRLKAQWESMHTQGNQHRVAVLEQGMKWRQIGVTPEEAQFLGTMEFHAEDVCRWFRVPPHMVGLTSKATSWGSGIEALSIGFVTYTLLPWLRRIEQQVRKDLIIAPDRYFAEFVIQGLLRGNLLDRYNAYAIGVQNGWLSPNDVRRLENMNARDDPGGEKYMMPSYMAPSAQAQPQRRPVAPGGAGTASAVHYRLLAEETAGRLLRKELAAMNKAHQRHQAEDLDLAIIQFYNDHAQLISQSLRITLTAATQYCEMMRRAVLDQGLGAFADEAGLVSTLADLATEGEL